MKKVLLIAVLLGALLSMAAYITCVAVPFADKAVKGSGTIVTRTMPAPEYDGISTSRAVQVIVSDKADQITIAADDNLIDQVEVKAHKGKLKVSMDNSIKNLSNIHVTVTVPANGKIRSLEASSASKITTAVALAAPQFTLDASSAANIEAAVKTDKCTVSASSAAKIELSGSAETFNVDLSSASKLNAEKFTAVNCNVETSSAAKAIVNCTGRLVASASSGSSIRYSGDCETRLEKSSGASIRKE